MNEKEKQDYLENYRKAKEKGVFFFPDILYKDAIVALVVLLILVGLAYFVGAKLEARANPADTAYTPRPEWYFLFLFQLLKYFPGSLEVIGVVIIPLIAFTVLILFPYIDRGPKRHFLNRPLITGLTLVGAAAIVALTLLAVFEEPPAAAIKAPNQAAALYLANCSGCHGAGIEVASDVSLHTIIAQGKHEGMPAWNADLSPDEIDALAGFILRPEGSRLFANYCAACHDVTALVESNPFELKNALDQGPDYPPHAGLDTPNWLDAMGAEGRTTLLNFLNAPDGERLYQVYCSSCHGSPSAFSMERAELRQTVEQGGHNVGMPAGNETLSTNSIVALAVYVVDPSQYPAGEALFQQHCSTCHSNVIPSASDVETAQKIITEGGSHRTMPVWGDVLTADQLDALIEYILSAQSLQSADLGQQLYNQYCAACHGEFGEGGANPALPGDIIAPISSEEYLKSRDDFTLRTIITQGQPNFGMSPFGDSAGGPLDDAEVDALLAYLRSWEANPPVEFPPEVNSDVLSMPAQAVFSEICAQCHGANGEGGSAPALNGASFLAGANPQAIYDSISAGHAATAMIAWGELLSASQIEDLVDYILALPPEGQEASPQETPAGGLSFTGDVLPVLERYCNACHGQMGGWDGTSYEKVIQSGDHGPAVIPGDVDNSLLAQKLLGKQTFGEIMPPMGTMPPEAIQVILDWIAAGAPEG